MITLQYSRWEERTHARAALMSAPRRPASFRSHPSISLDQLSINYNANKHLFSLGSTQCHRAVKVKGVTALVSGLSLSCQLSAVSAAVVLTIRSARVRVQSRVQSSQSRFHVATNQAKAEFLQVCSMYYYVVGTDKHQSRDLHSFSLHSSMNTMSIYCTHCERGGGGGERYVCLQ